MLALVFRQANEPCFGKAVIMAIAAVAFLAVTQTVASAQAFVFIKVADTSTPIPDDSGTFDNADVGGGAFGIPSVDAGTVVFRGRNLTSGHDGIYRFDPITLTLFAVADVNTPDPVQGGTLVNFGTPSTDAGNVAFPASSTTGNAGIYAEVDGSLTVIADRNTIIPGTQDTFDGFGDEPQMSGGYVAFDGIAGGSGAIFSNACSSLASVANTSTLVPGLAVPFLQVREPSFNGRTIVFEGLFAGGGGMFATDCSGSPIEVFPFATLSSSLDRGRFAVGSDLSGDEGASLVTIGGSTEVIADNTTAAPMGNGNFSAFGEPSTRNATVVFRAEDSSGRGGIYIGSFDSIAKVIAQNDLLDGKTVRQVRLGQNGFDGSNIAFQVDFTDSSEGIYVARSMATSDADADGEADPTDGCPETLEGSDVDGDGCSLDQFCALVDATTRHGRVRCYASDWMNDEPLMRWRDRDCTVDRGGRGRQDDLCIANW